ncbi:MAG: Hpt domain-containing protein [Magnetococcus sp. MYC-9]
MTDTRGTAEDAPERDDPEELDLTRLAEMRQELGDNFLMVMQLFQSGMLARPEKISQAFAASDPELLARESHSFKSVCRQLGLLRMGALAASLESMGRAGTLEGVAPLVEQLLASGAWAHHALKKYCSVRHAPPPFFEKAARTSPQE